MGNKKAKKSLPDHFPISCLRTLNFGSADGHRDCVAEEAFIVTSSVRQFFLNKNSIIVDASYKIEDLEQYFNIKISNDTDLEIDTVGGLIYSKINRIPHNNEVFDIQGLIKIKIIKASERKIFTIQIRKVDN